MKNKIVVFYNGLNYTFFTSLFRSIFNPIFVNIHSSITSLSLKHLGISKQVSNSLVYSIGLDTNLFLDSLVYQGSHGSNAALNATLVLPTMIYAEKSSTYLNLEGLLQKAHAGLSPDRLVKKDWEIFAAMFEFQKSYVTDFVGLNMSEFGVLVNSSNAWKEFSLKIPYWVGNNSIYVTSVSQKLILKSSIFLVRILNYYWNDIFSVNSKTMANCAKYIINKNYNYN